MINQIKIAAAILALMLSQTTWAATHEETSTADQAEPNSDLVETKVAPKKAKKVCKRSAPTGSRIGKKICMTEAAWDEMARKAKNTLDSSTRPTSNNPKGE